jgi:hypothetical protein
MNRTELLNLVRTTSLELMNACEGDGTIYACYGDDEIIAEFPGLMTKAQVIAKVRKMDSATADHLNEVLMFSGEYEMVNGVAVSKYQLEAQAELARIKAEAEADAEHEARMLTDHEYRWQVIENANELEAERASGFRT